MNELFLDADRFLDFAQRSAREIFESNDTHLDAQLPPHAVLFTNERAVYVPGHSCFETDETKLLFFEALRQAARALGAKAVVFVSEAWMKKLDENKAEVARVDALIVHVEVWADPCIHAYCAPIVARDGRRHLGEFESMGDARGGNLAEGFLPVDRFEVV